MNRNITRIVAIAATLAQAEQEGLIARASGRIAPTRRGQRFLNRLLETFLA